MESISAIIVDDNRYTREQLQDMLTNHFSQIHLLSNCANATEGLQAIKTHDPQLVFLDIEMPDMSGFQLLERIPEIHFETIFITSFNEYAIKAIRFSALDYLLKPIRLEELQKAIDRFTAKTSYRSDSKARVGNFILNMQTKQPREFRLAINTTEGTTFLLTDEIIRLEADVNYTNLFLTKGKKIMASRTLKEFNQLLADHDFIRTHKSHLVNMKFIQRITNDRHLLMTDNTKVEISTRKWDEVKSMLKIDRRS